MRARIKKRMGEKTVRVESGGDIKEVLINEDILNPKGETISLCFRGKDSSGIIDLNSKEADMVMNALKGRMHLVKDVKRFKERAF